MLLLINQNSHFIYSSRCCVKGPLLEVNDRLIKQPELLNTMIGEFVSSSMAIHSLKLRLFLWSLLKFLVPIS